MKNLAEDISKILVVEDRPAARMLISVLLQQLGYNNIGMVKKAISEGVTDYIVKPITLQALTNKVARALRKKRKHK